MSAEQSATSKDAMTFLGLHFPKISHRETVGNVTASTLLVIGYATGSWLFGTPLDRESAVALFVGFLYILLIDPFLAMNDAKVRRYAVASIGAGMLVASAAVVERLV